MFIMFHIAFILHHSSVTMFLYLFKMGSFFILFFSSLKCGYLMLYKKETGAETQMIPITIPGALAPETPVEIKEKRPERGTAAAYFPVLDYSSYFFLIISAFVFFNSKCLCLCFCFVFSLNLLAPLHGAFPSHSLKSSILKQPPLVF